MISLSKINNIPITKRVEQEALVRGSSLPRIILQFGAGKPHPLVGGDESDFTRN